MVRSVRRVLKNIYKTDIPLVETFNKIKEKYKETADKVVDFVKTNENYLGKSIIPINISCVIKEEEPPQEGEGDNKNEEQKENKDQPQNEKPPEKK